MRTNHEEVPRLTDKSNLMLGYKMAGEQFAVAVPATGEHVQEWMAGFLCMLSAAGFRYIQQMTLIDLDGNSIHLRNDYRNPEQLELFPNE